MKKDKSMCSGCRNNRYNFPGIKDGGAPVTCKECWSYKDAKVVKKKRVSINQIPPYKQKKVSVLGCKQEPGYAYVS
ncbi:MAG TPA: hypothetical protein ENH46_00725 [Candidatus Pacearchaeota archaeon]|nr:hypothetical protein [Candidatus Pacearchaeota archaeon]